jgi:hypothetical protein
LAAQADVTVGTDDGQALAGHAGEAVDADQRIGRVALSCPIVLLPRFDAAAGGRP